MAVLNKIRQKSVVLIVVIAMALFAFVLSDLFRSGTLFGGNPDILAVVNGKDINRVEFMQRVENRQSQMGPQSSAMQTMKSVWDQELRKLVLETEFEKLGLSVEKDQMRDIVIQSFSSFPEFQNEAGLFDENKLDAFISNLKDINPERAPIGNFMINYDEWVNNEQNLAKGTLEQSYYNLIKAGIGATISEAQAEYEKDSRTFDLKFAYVPYTKIADSLIEIKQSDIKNYVERNKQNYETEATRDIVFVEFIEKASEKDEEDIKNSITALLQDRIEFNESSQNEETIKGFLNTDDIETFVNANSDIKFVDRFLIKSQLPQAYADSLVKMPVGAISPVYKNNNLYQLTKVLDEMQVADSVKHSHIIVPYAGANRAEGITISREEAKSIVDSLLPLVKNNTAKFNEVASEINTDGTKANNGEVGWTRLTTFNPNAFDPDYANYIFFNPVGTVDIVETQFGYHIIRIDEAKNYERGIKIANLARRIEPSEETINEVFNQKGRFELAVQDKEFNEVATENNYTVKPVNGLKELDERIPGLDNQRSIVRWAFEDKTKVGDVKSFAIAGKGFAVVQLVKKTPKGILSVEDATAAALPKVRNEKKAEMIRKSVNATTVEDFASEQGETVRTANAVNMGSTTLAGAGNEPKVIGFAAGLKEGETSKLIDGDRGVYMLQVTKITDAPALDNYTAIANRLTNSRTGAVTSKAFEALKEAAQIEDNRATFY